MQRFFLPAWSVVALLILAGCASRAVSRYPSYQRTVAKYAGPGDFDGVPLPQGTDLCPDFPAECNCPKVWYQSGWVYHCGDYWIYWHHGYWYHYPYFQVYPYAGGPVVHQGPSRTIRKR